jgi:hypothetical protein
MPLVFGAGADPPPPQLSHKLAASRASKRGRAFLKPAFPRLASFRPACLKYGFLKTGVLKSWDSNLTPDNHLDAEQGL